MTFAKSLLSPVIALVMTGIGTMSSSNPFVIRIERNDTPTVQAVAETPEEPQPTKVEPESIPEPEPPRTPLTQRENNREIVKVYTVATFGADQVDAAMKIVTKESNFNNIAQNNHSTAYGMWQFLDSTWGGYGIKTSDPIQQTEAAMRYIKARYGTPQNALSFHNKMGWY